MKYNLPALFLSAPPHTHTKLHKLIESASSPFSLPPRFISSSIPYQHPGNRLFKIQIQNYSS